MNRLPYTGRVRVMGRQDCVHRMQRIRRLGALLQPFVVSEYAIRYRWDLVRDQPSSFCLAFATSWHELSFNELFFPPSSRSACKID